MTRDFLLNYFSFLYCFICHLLASFQLNSIHWYIMKKNLICVNVLGFVSPMIDCAYIKSVLSFYISEWSEWVWACISKYIHANIYYMYIYIYLALAKFEKIWLIDMQLNHRLHINTTNLQSIEIVGWYTQNVFYFVSLQLIIYIYIYRRVNFT